ncbi:conserved hypothetical protein [Ricinus communis]|uniref:Uncharacterized protein n=1 Tax=Ricinus communis TaxID=3988 RepID=B9TAH4_RICCO|nr:conserved hypothetical protein [Ricinus communis]
METTYSELTAFKIATIDFISPLRPAKDRKPHVLRTGNHDGNCDVHQRPSSYIEHGLALFAHHHQWNCTTHGGRPQLSGRARYSINLFGSSAPFLPGEGSLLSGVPLYPHFLSEEGNETAHHSISIPLAHYFEDKAIGELPDRLRWAAQGTRTSQLAEFRAGLSSRDFFIRQYLYPVTFLLERDCQWSPKSGYERAAWQADILLVIYPMGYLLAATTGVHQPAESTYPLTSHFGNS